MFDLYADVLLPLPLKQCYTYSVPAPMGEYIQVGMRVSVQLRKREQTAIVTKLHNLEPSLDIENTYKVLPIEALVDKAPVINLEQLELAYWMAEQYLCNPGEALFKMFPKAKRWPAEEDTITQQTPKIEYELTPPQSQIYKKIRAGLYIKDNKKHNPAHLLHGITGSGKTEIYIHLLRDALLLGHSALLLVPEISLTIQLLQRLERVFEDQLALLHSGLSNQKRFQAYVGILQGTKKIVVGTRSAVFAPLTKLGLVILDEEHDGSFKENSTPRYDARQIALKRATTHNTLVVFGSATPRVELSYYARSSRSQFIYHSLEQRAQGSSLAKVCIVSLPSPDAIISPELLEELKINLERKEQSILLLNRRGYYPQVYNANDNSIESCPSCSISLNLHRDHLLRCHYCGFQRTYTGSTADGSPAMLVGTGTQKLEDFLLNHFPNARIERLDSDAIQKRNVLQDTLLRFLEREIDILIGTQMIARGLDAPHVSLVGVLQAEKGLHLPDFRAAEKTFSLLTQVAGRAGRGHLTGRVIFECFDTEHPLLQAAAAQNYEAFYQAEIPARAAAFYPPFSRIVRLLCRGPKQERIQN